MDIAQQNQDKNKNEVLKRQILQLMEILDETDPKVKQSLIEKLEAFASAKKSLQTDVIERS